MNNSSRPVEPSVLRAAVQLRAIVKNREVGATPLEQRAWDDRVAVAEVHLETALLEAGQMAPEDAIEEISIEGHDVTVVFEGRECIILHTLP